MYVYTEIRFFSLLGRDPQLRNADLYKSVHLCMWFYVYFVSVRLCILPDGELPASSWTSPASDSALFLPLDGLRGVVDPLRQHQSAVAPFPSAELPPGGGNLCSLSSSLAPSSALTPPELFTLPQTPSLFVDFSYCHL